MKIALFKLSDHIPVGRHVLTAAAFLVAGALNSSATVTVQGWWHLDSTQPINDSSGNSRTFGSAYSTAPATGGAVAAQLINNGAGGPLDATGWTSSECILIGVGVGGKRQSSMWGLGYNPPAQNFGIEIWVLPQGNGIAGGSGGWIFSSGQSGGVALRINAPAGNPSYIDAFDVGNSATIGSQALIDTNKWMHLALVNAGGVTTFYTNGVPCGPSLANATTASAGDVYMLSAPGDNQAFYGYLDEARMFTFASGAFSTNDLLLRPPGPNIVGPPQNAVVWNGGAAPFTIASSFDNSLVYQWQRGGSNIAGATAASYLLPVAAPADSGSTFDSIVISGSLSVTSAPASLTIVTPNPSNVAAYRNVITAEPSLVAYFPVDGCTNAVLTNVVNVANNGALQNNASFDGRTNRSFGQRALSFNVDGDVQVPNNPAFEFPSGFGTIEALVYLSQATAAMSTIVSENYEGGYPVYAFGADPTGSFLVYSNFNSTAPTALSWAVPGGLIGRFLEVELVFDNLNNVTPYVNGQSLGTQVQAGFGSDFGGSLWIGGIGNLTTGNRWAGTIDELAVYKTNLSAAAIQSHYTKLVFGTNNVPPVIVSQSSSKTLLAGGSPTLSASVTGALPLTYQWTSNSVPIAGATSSTLTLSQTKTNDSATYSLTVTNVFGSTNTQPIVLAFLAPPAGYLSQVMHDNPSALWRLAETNGSTAVDSAGLNDAIYATSGVTYSPGTGGPPGDTAAGALFNGSSGGAATPGNFPALNPSGPFSVEFWGSLATYGFYVPLGSMDRVAHPRAGGYEWYVDGNSPGYEFHTAEAGGYSLLCADNTVPPNGTWFYLTGIWDTTNLYLYVNGQLGDYQIDPPAPAGTDNFTAEGLGQTAFVPNTSAPFIIGYRDDNTHYYHGTIADVAFYNYALTPAQISNHWSYGWVPSQVLSSPAGVTNVENSTVTLTPTVVGVPNSYQWFLGNAPLNDLANFDGSAHFPNDVTNVSLVISQAKPSDSGQYRLFITNPVGNSTSAVVSVLITANTNPPAVSAVIPLGTPNTSGGTTPYLVKVAFTQRVDPTTGADTSKYTFNPSVTITGMTLLGSGANDVAAQSLGADWREAILVTSGLTPGKQYGLTVSGVKDQSQTPLTIPTTTKYFRGPLLTPGVVNWDYYYLGNSGGGVVSALTGNYNYPNAPQTNSYFTALDSDQITGGDLNNNPAFGSLGDNYGDVVSGWITPTVSGAYTFFLASDDKSELDLSPDANPGDAVMIANEPGCCHGFTEPSATSPPLLTSNPQNLTAGTSYFIRALHGEGTGGDYVKVAWRISTDSTPATNLPPIAASVLSAYQPVAPPQFGTPALSGGTLTLGWSGYQAVIQQSTNLVNWTAVPGNPNPLVVVVKSAPAMFYRLVQ